MPICSGLRQWAAGTDHASIGACSVRPSLLGVSAEGLVSEIVCVEWRRSTIKQGQLITIYLEFLFLACHSGVCFSFGIGVLSFLLPRIVGSASADRSYRSLLRSF